MARVVYGRTSDLVPKFGTGWKRPYDRFSHSLRLLWVGV